MRVSARRGGLTAGPGESLTVAVRGELDITTAPPRDGAGREWGNAR
jgi:hypothetical protein